MGRPPKPLISRSSTVAASIEIIDTVGMDAFSLPRVAERLNVKPPRYITISLTAVSS